MNTKYASKDELNLNQDRFIKSQFEKDEKVLFSTYVNKYNDRAVLQPRIILVTTNYQYNIAFEGILITLLRFINPAAVIRRKVPIDCISAFTVSSNPFSDQFVIHIEKQNDLRYSVELEKREAVLKAICLAFRLKTGRKIPFHFEADTDLASYHTSEADVKINISKRPCDAALPLSDRDLKLGLHECSKKRKQKKCQSFYHSAGFLDKANEKSGLTNFRSFTSPRTYISSYAYDESSNLKFSKVVRSFLDSHSTHSEEVGPEYSLKPVTLTLAGRKEVRNACK